MEEPNFHASEEAATGDAANGQLGSGIVQNDQPQLGDAPNKKQRDTGGEPEGPKNLSPPLFGQQAPVEELHPQHPLPSTGDAHDAVVCVNPENNSEDISDTGLSSARAEELLAVYGPNAVKAKQIPEWKKVVQRYLRVTPILLLIASLLSVSVEVDGSRDWLSFGLLLFLCNVMVWADYLGERSASDAISAVEKLAAVECSVKRDGSYGPINVVDLVPGDVIWLKAGMVVPADGVFVPPQKHICVDESALTGESLPIKKFRGSELLSGSVVQRGEGAMLVQRTGVHSFYGKTIALLARAESKGHLRTILDAAAKVLTWTAVGFAVFLIFWERFHPVWRENSHGDASVGILFKRAFTLIAAVIPAAMPVVTTTVLAVGAVAISKEHAVVSRLSAIEEAAGVEILCTDKTGTLTLNLLSLSRDEICTEAGFTPDQVLLYASLAATLTDPDALDAAINAAVDMGERQQFEVLDYTPFNPVDKRADSIVRSKTGEVTLVTKGAPHVISELVCAPGDTATQQRLRAIIEEKARRGLRTLGVAIKPVDNDAITKLDEASEICNKTAWKLVGFLSLLDPPRPDTKDTLERSKGMGISVKMLTGDQQAIAAETARLLGLGDNISGPEIFRSRPKGLESDLAFREYISSVDGFSGVYPEHKFEIVDNLQQGGCLVAMTGDGVNDAPALKRATVGIAVSGATEAARAAADIILLEPGLSSIITVFSLSRQIFKRIEAYITFRIHGSFMTLLFWWGCVVIFDYEYPTWVLVLVAIINDFVLMSCSRDNVPSSSMPLIWSMLQVSTIALLTATLMAVCILLYIFLSDPKYGVNWWTAFGLEGFETADIVAKGKMPESLQTTSGVWLLFTICIQVSFHSCRTHRFALLYGPENRAPSFVVLTPQILAIVLTLFLSVYWKYDWKISSGPRMIGISWGHAGITILWGILWFVLIDVCKVLYCYYLWPHIAKLEEGWKRRFGKVTPEERQLRGKVRLALKTMEEQRKKTSQAWQRQRQLVLDSLRLQKAKSGNQKTQTTKTGGVNSCRSHKLLANRRGQRRPQVGGRPFKRQGLDQKQKNTSQQ